jgi:acyl-CoA thioesterase FadM
VDVLHKTEVTADQIDHLGHMNVRYYGENARIGAGRLLASVGLDPDAARAAIQRDTYTRHHREQLVGAPLEVRGGVLDATPERIRLYEELVNADTDDVAATFVLTFAVPDGDAPTPLTGDVLAAARSATVSMPEHGRPRSISLEDDPAGAAPAPSVLVERGLAMRLPRTVTAIETAGQRSVAPNALAELVWGGEPAPGREFRPLEDTDDGSQIGFAILETRATWVRDASVGDRVQSFGAELAVESKTMLSRNWLVDMGRDELIGVFTVVNIAFDVGARRAVVIPDEVRARLGRRLHADLA